MKHILVIFYFRDSFDNKDLKILFDRIAIYVYNAKLMKSITSWSIEYMMKYWFVYAYVLQKGKKIYIEEERT